MNLIPALAGTSEILDLGGWGGFVSRFKESGVVMSQGSSKSEEESDKKAPHLSVMSAEVLEAFDRLPGGALIADLTLGRGGHAKLLLEKGFRVLGFDQDSTAIEYCEEHLASFGDQFTAIHRSFRELRLVLSELGLDGVDGILVDLGVSSPQLDVAARGFSFQAEGPLDMRMDRRAGETAADLVNQASEEELIRIFRELGEEPQARRVASAILEAREIAPVETTLQLAELVETVIPRRGRRHPATRIFQGLRLAVNDELGAVEALLADLSHCLRPGGVFACIAFHSLEDRIVKRSLRAGSREWNDRPEWPEPRKNPDYFLRLPSRRALKPTEEEVNRNPRSRSARLRVAERIENEES